jgi:hypothetical protein
MGTTFMWQRQVGVERRPRRALEPAAGTLVAWVRGLVDRCVTTTASASIVDDVCDSNESVVSAMPPACATHS